jgi:hypothetical protein
MAATCYGCGSALHLDGPVGRRATCPECDAELHACVNCRHFDESAAHQCREPHAEPVVEKESANACDLFQLGDGAARRRGGKGEEARARLAALFGEAPRQEEDPRDALEALFRKK